MSEVIHIHSFAAEIAEQKKASNKAALEMRLAIQKAKELGITFGSVPAKQ